MSDMQKSAYAKSWINFVNVRVNQIGNYFLRKKIVQKNIYFWSFDYISNT